MTKSRYNLEVGSWAETQACKILQQKGLLVLAKNYRCKGGEIDIIAQDGNILVFVEVKYRRNARWADPAEAVTQAKIRRIRHAARHFLMKHPQHTAPCRFDVVTFCGDATPTWIQQAFD